MSGEIEEKTRAPIQSADTIARQTLAQLRERWGGPKIVGAPVEIVISGMSREVWRRVGMDLGSKTTYELQRF